MKKLFTHLFPVMLFAAAPLEAKVYKISEEDAAIKEAIKENKAIAYVIG